jgi:UDP-glucose 4-epimerase
VKVLVTGGSGFIGSHVVDRLAAQGHEPVNFDLQASQHHPPTELKSVLGDIADRDTAWRAARGCDAIIHLAAVADVNDVVADPVRADRINVHGTQMILEAARHAGITRVVYGSTVWVYGNAPVDGMVDEESPLALPAHFYTATKLAGEMYCRSYTHLYGIEHTILRFGIPYGPRARLAAVVPAFVSRAQEGKALSIAGDGLQTRQFVYVEDLADGILAVHDQGRIGESYNLAGQQGTLGDLIDKTAALVGRKPPRVTLPPAAMKLAIPIGPLVGKAMGFPGNLGELIRTSDGVTFWMTDQKARSELGFAPRDLDAGLRQTLGIA